MMMLQTEGIIYLSDNRVCTQNEDFRSFTTRPVTPTTELVPTNREGGTRILKINDNTLVGSKNHKIQAGNANILMIMPLVGALEIYNNGLSILLEPGCVRYISFKNKGDILIKNPYESELINYLEIQVQTEENTPHFDSFTHFFNLNKPINTLHPLFNRDKRRNSDKPFKLQPWIGQFGGRIEGKIELDDAQSTLFVYVIDGVFEVQNRLLQTRDGLLLKHLDEAEFEALADNSILFHLVF